MTERKKPILSRPSLVNKLNGGSLADYCIRSGQTYVWEQMEQKEQLDCMVKHAVSSCSFCSICSQT